MIQLLYDIEEGIETEDAKRFLRNNNILYTTSENLPSNERHTRILLVPRGKDNTKLSDRVLTQLKENDDDELYILYNRKSDDTFNFYVLCLDLYGKVSFGTNWTEGFLSSHATQKSKLKSIFPNEKIEARTQELKNLEELLLLM